MRGWLTFLAGLEIGLFVLALIGPGHPSRVPRGEGANSIASLFIDSPTYWQSVGVNFVALNAFMAIVIPAAHVVGQRKHDGR